MPRNKYIGKKNKARSESYDKQKDENGWYKFTPYEITQKENKLFEKYYRQLNICATKEEFDEMLQILKKPLPITFRITSYKSFSKEILDILKSKHFKYLDEICKEDNGELVASAIQKQSTLLKSDETKLPCEIGENGQIYECLKWYPNEMAWKVLLSKADVRKNTHFEEFKSFLVHQTENGNLNRQEAVSMIPPLCLDIKSHHKILDMCASPGSTFCPPFLIQSKLFMFLIYLSRF
jgi:16S rRNA C967 or C1407 C5-methylase (RsmB/RsmF family)